MRYDEYRKRIGTALVKGWDINQLDLVDIQVAIACIKYVVEHAESIGWEEFERRAGTEVTDRISHYSQEL